MDTTFPNSEDGMPESRSTKPELKPFGHKFFSPELAPLRKVYFTILGSSLVLTILVMWLCLPVYWGSLSHAPNMAPSLRGWFIDRDGSELGAAIASAVMGSTMTGGKNHLGWQQIDPAAAPTGQDVERAVVDERTWVAVVVEAGATARLNQARESGDASYSPAQAISVYFAQGRNELAVGNYVIPITTALLSQATTTFSRQSTARYLTARAGNATALQLLAQAPQTVVSPVYWTTYNVRPYTAPVATAITLVGNIYLIIFAFVMTMTNAAARDIIGPYVSTASYIRVRVFLPFLVYIPLSLSYSMISLPFHLPFGAKYSYAGGFFIFFLISYLGMCSLGLATEAVITLLGPRFMAFFLLPLIIINISVTVLPNELQPWFYKYGPGFPIYNLSQAIRTIIFNTKSHLGRNAGVLIAWIILSCITIPLFTLIMRRREERIASKNSKGDRTPDPEHDEGEAEEKGKRINSPKVASASL